ncbi:MAG: hypothetical protein B6U87_01370 [Candidatus Aenigmarchaeota archaeon ex4484_52]|nr:MAG: hypothetical protein B6U87_01370 [Candidatus Aenigmarchaeota archaeon ex4484_52]
MKNNDNEDKNIEMINALKNIGLNSYERQIYASLVKQGFANSNQLSQTTNVPRSRTYDVLQSLENKGFAKAMHTKPKKYAAVHPVEAIENAKNNLEKKYKEELEKINKFYQSEDLDILKNLYNKKSIQLEDAMKLTTLKNNKDFEKTFNSMIESAEKQICIITTERGLFGLSKHFTLLKKTAQSGVKIRIITPITQKNITQLKKIAQVADIRDLNKFYKKFNKFNGTLIFIDNKEAIISILDQNNFSYKSPLLWMKSDHFCQNFAKINFELMWKQLEEADN